MFPGSETTYDIILSDNPGVQTKCLPAPQTVQTFEIKITNIFPGTGANQNIVATREITALAGGCQPT